MLDQNSKDIQAFIKHIQQLLNSTQIHPPQIQAAIDHLKNVSLDYNNPQIIKQIYHGLALYCHPDKARLNTENNFMTILNGLYNQPELFKSIIKQIKNYRQNYFTQQSSNQRAKNQFHDYGKQYYQRRQNNNGGNQPDNNPTPERFALDSIISCKIDLESTTDAIASYRYRNTTIPESLGRHYDTIISTYQKLKQQLASHPSQMVQIRMQELERLYNQKTAAYKPAGKEQFEGKSAAEFAYKAANANRKADNINAAHKYLQNMLTSINRTQIIYSSLNQNKPKTLAEKFLAEHTAELEEYHKWLQLEQNQTILREQPSIATQVQQVEQALSKNRILANHLNILAEIDAIKNLTNFSRKDHAVILEEYDKFFNKLDGLPLGDDNIFRSLKNTIKTEINIIKNNQKQLLTLVKKPADSAIHTPPINNLSNNIYLNGMVSSQIKDLDDRILKLFREFELLQAEHKENPAFTPYNLIMSYNKIIENYNNLQKEFHAKKSQFRILNTKYRILADNISKLYNSLKAAKPNYEPDSWLNHEQINQARRYFSTHPGEVKYSRKVSGLPCSIIKGEDGKLYAISRSTANHLGIKGLLGKGSYGRVKLAQCLDNNIIIAAKVQNPPYQELQQDIAYEEEVLAVVQEYLGKAKRSYPSQHTTLKTKYYTFSKFIQGKSLRNYLLENQLDRNKKLDIILKVLESTKELHAKGVIHGDLSFNNILYDSNNDKVTIIDFGYAQKLNQPLSQQGLVKWRLKIYKANAYLPPEMVTTYNPRTNTEVAGQIGYKSDVFSLGKWIEWFSANDPEIKRLAANMTKSDIQGRANIDDCITQVKKLLNSRHNYSR